VISDCVPPSVAHAAYFGLLRLMLMWRVGPVPR
jgi:hypothetical protein